MKINIFGKGHYTPINEIGEGECFEQCDPYGSGTCGIFIKISDTDVLIGGQSKMFNAVSLSTGSLISFDSDDMMLRVRDDLYIAKEDK